MNPTAPDLSAYQSFCVNNGQHSTSLIKDESSRQSAQCSLSGDNPHILNQPRQLFCGHRVCESCLDGAFLQQDQFLCPATTSSAHPQNGNGRCNKVITDKGHADRACEGDIKRLVVGCAFAREGCLWQGKYEHYSTVHVAECELGKRRFVTDMFEKQQNLLVSREAALSSTQAEVDRLTAENARFKERDVESQQVITQLTDVVALRDCTIKALKKELADTLEKELADRAVLEKKLADRDCQIESHEVIMQMLQGDIANLTADRRERQAPVAPASPQNVPKPAKSPANVLAKNEAKVQNTQAGIVTPSASGAIARLPSGARSQTFQIKSDEMYLSPYDKVSRTFELDGIKAEFMFGKSYKHSPIGLFFRLHGGADSTCWPCAKTMTFTVKELSGRGEKENIVRSVHFPRAPEQCKNKPGEEPGTAVGFREFCSEEDLEFSLDGRKPKFFDHDGCYHVEVLVRDTKLDEIAGPAYELDYNSVGLYWAIRGFEHLRRQSDTYRNDCFSPVFLTAENGYRLKLKMDLSGSTVPGKCDTTIRALLEEDKPGHLAWPLKGVLSIRLLDRNPVTRNDVECLLPIEFTKPSGTNYGSRAASDEVRFFSRVLLNRPVVPEKSYYQFHNEIVIEASFLRS